MHIFLGLSANHVSHYVPQGDFVLFQSVSHNIFFPLLVRWRAKTLTDLSFILNYHLKVEQLHVPALKQYQRQSVCL